MNTTTPAPKTINELRGYRFFIPSYQRGYRWTDKDVKAFLDDIYEFDCGTENSPKKYCLQPLIVTERSDGSYEVVDGQQRLTTVFIFLKLAQSLTGFEPYKITFETRERSQSFLDSLSNYSDEIPADNIDYYHIINACKTINQWLDKKSEVTPRFSVLSSMFIKIVDHVFFIWHEISGDSKPVEIFTRVNMGKISLSNAELIKALIFNKNNFQRENDAEKEQQELSLAWNRIERGLQNDAFWMFINEKTEYETRIDLIFSYLSAQYNRALPQELQYKDNSGQTEKYSTFLIFYTAYKNCGNHKNEFVKKLWQEVETIYERFQEWYSDLNKYHIIGYLIASGVSLHTIFELTYEKKKSEITKALINKTRCEALPKFDNLVSFENLTYGEEKRKLRNLFLLFNIATLVCKNEKHYRFPFDIYKKEKWDIEHIHATNDDSSENDDYIRNLTLLPAKINRSYQDDCFAEKRKEIIKRDKVGWFIPLCTKNVFLKQYSTNPVRMDIWDKESKTDYINEMWNTLESFWKGDFLNELQR